MTGCARAVLRRSGAIKTFSFEARCVAVPWVRAVATPRWNANLRVIRTIGISDPVRLCRAHLHSATATRASAGVDVSELLLTYGDNHVKLAHLLCDRHVDGSNLALRYEDQDGHTQTLTYAELSVLSSSFARFLQRDAGVKKGDRVAILLPRTVELMVAAVAVWRLGAVYVPLFCAFGSEAIHYRLENSGAKVIVTDHANRAKVGLPVVRSVAAAASTSTAAGVAQPADDALSAHVGRHQGAGRKRRQNDAQRHISTTLYTLDANKAEAAQEGRGAGLGGSGIVVVNTSLKADGDAADGQRSFWQAVSADAEKTVLPPAVVEGESPIALVYTSGTTGKAKGVIVPARALASFEMYMRCGLEVRPDDRFMNMGDPGWAYGLYYALLGPLVLGTTTIFLNARFEPARCLAALQKYRVTNFAAAPTVYRAMRGAHLSAHSMTSNGGSDGAAASRAGHVAHSLRRASSAGEPLEPEVSRWGESFFGVRIRDHYGQTELGMVAGQTEGTAAGADCEGESAPADPSLAAGISSMGHALPGFSLAVMRPTDEAVRAVSSESKGNASCGGVGGDGALEDDGVVLPDGTAGELAVDVGNSPLFWFRGYLGNEAQTASRFGSRGHYLTGDVALRHARTGEYVFTGRADDVIKTAGYRVGPFEVESALAAHPQVVEAAVIGVPDDVKGLVIKAFLVLAPHAHAYAHPHPHTHSNAPHAASIASGASELGRHSQAYVRLVDELKLAVRSTVGSHAVPRQFEIVDALPKTPSGKVQRNVLKQREQERASSQ